MRVIALQYETYSGRMTPKVDKQLIACQLMVIVPAPLQARADCPLIGDP
jgi:hypothetical protein